MTRLASISFGIFLVFHHYQVTTVFNYPITIGALAGIVALGALGAKLDLTRLLFGSLFLWSVVVINLLAWGASAAPSQMYRTFALFQAAVLILSARPTKRSRTVFDSSIFRWTTLACLAVITTLSVLQTLTGSFGSVTLFNPFRQHQYLYNYKPDMVAALPRAQGFYLEPSYDALVIGATAVLLLALRHKPKFTMLLAITGTLATQSATGLIVLLILVVVAGLRGNLKSLAAGLLLSGSLLFVAGGYLVGRLDSIGESGSSAYYRFVGPISVLRDVLSERPLGQTLGSLDSVVASYGILNGSAVGSSLDNGIYVLVYYFGFPAIVGLAALLTACIRSSFKASRAGAGYSWVVPLWLYASLVFSGGVMLPEYLLLIWFTISAYAMRGQIEREQFGAQPLPPTFRRGGHLSGRAGNH